MALRFDTGTVGKVQRTPQGGLRVDAALTRTGVFVYFEGGREIREYRPPDEVFNADSLATLADAPVTLEHPPGEVTPENYQKYAVGLVSGEARQDGELVTARLVVQDARTLAAIEAGTREVSCGYHCKLDNTPGVSPAGEPFDRVQRSIQYNHVAIVKRGRAGSTVALRLDAEGNQIPSEVSTVTEQEIAALRAQLAEKDAQISALTARADVAESRASDTSALDAAVNARLALIDKARKFLGAEFKADGLSTEQIQAKVIAKVRPTLKLDGRDAAYLATAFELVQDLAPAEAPRADSAVTEAAKAVLETPEPRKDAADDAKAKHQARVRALGTAPLSLSKDSK
jgi:hypothetical protein